MASTQMTRCLSMGACFAVLLLQTGAVAQITDPEQRRAWFYLQHLSAEAGSIENCIAMLAVEGIAHGRPTEQNAAWTKYNRVTDELAREVEGYVRKYVVLLPNKTVYSYTHDVWQVVTRVGSEKAREATKDRCDTLLAD